MHKIIISLILACIIISPAFSQQLSRASERGQSLMRCGALFLVLQDIQNDKIDEKLAELSTVSAWFGAQYLSVDLDYLIPYERFSEFMEPDQRILATAHRSNGSNAFKELYAYCRIYVQKLKTFQRNKPKLFRFFAFAIKKKDSLVINEMMRNEMSEPEIEQIRNFINSPKKMADLSPALQRWKRQNYITTYEYLKKR